MKRTKSEDRARRGAVVERRDATALLYPDRAGRPERRRAVRSGSPAWLADVLRVAHEGAATTLYSDRVALYLARLTEAPGFALALAVHRRGMGPSPEAIRDRALRAGASAPVVAGAAPIEGLARTVEGLTELEPYDRDLVARAIRARSGTADVPVLVLLDNEAAVTTLRRLSSAYGEGPERMGEA